MDERAKRQVEAAVGTVEPRHVRALLEALVVDCGEGFGRAVYRGLVRRFRLEHPDEPLPRAPEPVVAVEPEGPGLSVPMHISCDDAASLLGVSHWTVRRLVSKGELPASKIGSRVVVSLRAVAEYRRAHAVQVAE